MIESLTRDQDNLIQVVLDECIQYATGTETNREVAEKSVRVLLGGLLGQEFPITWVCMPYFGVGGLSVSEQRPFGESMSTRVITELADNIKKPLLIMLANTIFKVMADAILGYKDPELDKMTATSPLSYWMWPIVALFQYGARIGVPYSEEAVQKLTAITDFLKSSAALWVTKEGGVVLCQRPLEIRIENGWVTRLDFTKNVPFSS